GLGTQLAHQAVEHTQNIKIVTLLWNGVAECFHAGAARVFDQRERVGDEEGAERGTQNDDELPWLEEHADMSAHGDKAAQHTTQCDDKTDDNAQSSRLPRTNSFIAPYGARLARTLPVNLACRGGSNQLRTSLGLHKDGNTGKGSCAWSIR